MASESLIFKGSKPKATHQGFTLMGLGVVEVGGIVFNSCEVVHKNFYKEREMSMRIAFFLFLVGSLLPAEEHHARTFHVEPGVGVRVEKKFKSALERTERGFFLEPTVEWVEGRLHPSVEGGFFWRRFDFFTGIRPLRAGVNIPVRGEWKFAFVLERHQTLEGVSIPLKKYGELVFLGNEKRTFKVLYLFRISK